MKRLFSMLCILAVSLSLIACSRQNETTATAPSVTAPSSLGVSAEELFSDRDDDATYNDSEAIAVTLNGSGAGAASSLVSSENGVVTLKGAGTYLLSGELSGQIIVDAPKEDKLQLVLRGVTVACDTSSALYIRQADKVFLTLDEGTENKFTTTGEFVAIDENSLDAAIFSKEDLTINGSGSLTVTCVTNHGIVSKDDLAVTGGTVTVTAAGHGLCAKDQVKVSGGTFIIHAGKDGIHAENKDDATLGSIYLAGSTWNITADGDAVDAAASLQIDSGTYTLSSGGGSQNASIQSNGEFNPNWGQWGGYSSTSQSTAGTSAKGLKASGDLIINNGTVAIDSSDDALHSNSSLYIMEGALTLSSGDDGVHADNAILIAGGTVTITKSYEGIEAQNITISGGTLHITASDDGLNAAGGNDASGMGGRPGQGSFNSNADTYLSITGGSITVDAGGDGLDSNGALYVSGGTTYVSGPTNSGNGALDYDSHATATGGVVIAAGASGMAQNFSTDSTQACILYTTGSCAAGTPVALRDTDGNTLASYSPAKPFSSVVITAPGLEENADFVLVIGDDEYELTLNGYLYGNGGGDSMGAMGKPGRPGGR